MSTEKCFQVLYHFPVTTEESGDESIFKTSHLWGGVILFPSVVNSLLRVGFLMLPRLLSLVGVGLGGGSGLLCLSFSEN